MPHPARRIAAILPLLACITLGGWPAGADTTPGAQPGFESAPVGPLAGCVSDGLAFSAEAGHATITDGHAKEGRRALRLAGGTDKTVTLAGRGIAKDAEISFGAQRWTAKGVCQLRLDGWDGRAWKALWKNDGVPLKEYGGPYTAAIPERTERLRFVCTSEAGVLLDGIRIAPPSPMAVRDCTTLQPVLPMLAGTGFNPLARIEVNTDGRLKPRAIRRVRVTLRGTTDLADMGEIAVFAADGAGPKGAALATAKPAAGPMDLQVNQPLAPGPNALWISAAIPAGANLDHHLDAGCLEVELDDGTVLKPAIAEPPGFQRLGLPLRQGGDDKAKVYRIPGLAATPKGTLIAVYDIRWGGGADLPADIDVGISRSTDGGRSWSPMKIALDAGRDPKFNLDGVGDPAVLVDRKTGTVWVAALWSHGRRGWNGSGPGLGPKETGQFLLVKSEDDGETWSKPVNITAQAKNPAWKLFFNGPGAGICMQDGTLVFAAQFRDEKGVPHSTLIASGDHGRTWIAGTGAFPGTTEAQLAEIAPGELMINCRNDGPGGRRIATTRDLGATWTEHPTSLKALVEPGACQGGLLHVQQSLGAGCGGTLLFSNPAVDSPPRRQLSITASADAGKTWRTDRRLLLDSGISAGYSCMAMIDKDTVGILYEGSRAHLTFQRVPLADILDGSKPSP